MLASGVPRVIALSMVLILLVIGECSPEHPASLKTS